MVLLLLQSKECIQQVFHPFWVKHAHPTSYLPPTNLWQRSELHPQSTNLLPFDQKRQTQSTTSLASSPAAIVFHASPPLSLSFSPQFKTPTTLHSLVEISFHGDSPTPSLSLPYLHLAQSYLPSSNQTAPFFGRGRICAVETREDGIQCGTGHRHRRSLVQARPPPRRSPRTHRRVQL